MKLPKCTCPWTVDLCGPQTDTRGFMRQRPGGSDRNDVTRYDLIDLDAFALPFEQLFAIAEQLGLGGVAPERMALLSPMGRDSIQKLNTMSHKF